MYCKDCKRWERENQIIGLCTHLVQVCDEIIKRQDEPANLYTFDNFGCIHFEKRGPFRLDNDGFGLCFEPDSRLDWRQTDPNVSLEEVVEWLNDIFLSINRGKS